MPDDQLDRLDERLAALAGQAQRSARLAPPQTVRAHADRRRRRRQAVAGSLGVLLVAALGTGAVLAQRPGPDTGPPVAALTGPPSGPSAVPSSPAARSTAPSPSDSTTEDPVGGSWVPKPGTTSKEGVLSGKRLTALVPSDLRGLVAVESKSREVVTTAKDDSWARFMIVPWKGDDHLIFPLKLAYSGDLQCLEAKEGSGFAMGLVVTRCDPDVRSNQLFTFEDRGKNAGGATRWAIRTGVAYLQVDPEFERDPAKAKLIAQNVGDAGPATFFTLPDRGPAPKGD